jgi:hypothetical protein
MATVLWLSRALTQGYHTSVRGTLYGELIQSVLVDLSFNDSKWRWAYPIKTLAHSRGAAGWGVYMSYVFASFLTMSCDGSGLAIGRSPVQVVVPNL